MLNTDYKIEAMKVPLMKEVKTHIVVSRAFTDVLIE